MASDATVDDVMADTGAETELRCPFGAGPAAAPGTRRRPKRGYLLPGTIALVVCAVIGVGIDLAGIQSHAPSNLAGGQVEAFLSQSLQYTHPQASPPQVRCPADEPLRTGYTFDCTLVKDGRSAGLIRVTETSATGTFSYQPPPSS
jgi:hypothetical protein